MNDLLHVGLDVGSTTVKIVVMNESKETIYRDYQRHFSDTKNTICEVLESLTNQYSNNRFTIALTGSGAMSAAGFLGLPFIQEVVSCKRAVEKYIPQTDVVIELGGEDAKIIYFDTSIEQRMNGTCAGRHRRLFRSNGFFTSYRYCRIKRISKNIPNYLSNRFSLWCFCKNRCATTAK